MVEKEAPRKKENPKGKPLRYEHGQMPRDLDVRKAWGDV
jgi:hypothetical protein